MKNHLLIILSCIGLVSCAHNNPIYHSEPDTFHKDAILILDNSGGYSHGGRRLELLKNGQVIDTRYSDIIGDDSKSFGSYQMTGDTLILKFGDRGTQILKRATFSGEIYWVYPDEIKALQKPANTWIRQISLRQKSEQGAGANG